MDNDELVRNWHNKIKSVCEKRLDRKLTTIEKKFIESRGSFIALEIIEDAVLDMRENELVKYINSEK